MMSLAVDYAGVLIQLSTLTGFTVVEVVCGTNLGCPRDLN